MFFVFAMQIALQKYILFFNIMKKSAKLSKKNPHDAIVAGIFFTGNVCYFSEGLAVGFVADAGVAMLERMSVSAWMFFMR